MCFCIDGPNNRQIRCPARIPVQHEPVRSLRHTVADIGSPANLAAQITTPFRLFVADTDRLH